MKIGIIGASGKSGRHLTEEALRQEHTVTAIVRDANKMDVPGVTILSKDIFSLTEEDGRGFDAVIDAFNAPAGKDYAMAMIDGMTNGNFVDKRFTVVSEKQ